MAEGMTKFEKETERADSEVEIGLKNKNTGMFAKLLMLSNGRSGCPRSCCGNSEVDSGFEIPVELGASVDFATHTPHMLVCESPGHCREKEQN